MRYEIDLGNLRGRAADTAGVIFLRNLREVLYNKLIKELDEIVARVVVKQVTESFGGANKLVIEVPDPKDAPAI